MRCNWDRDITTVSLEHGAGPFGRPRRASPAARGLWSYLLAAERPVRLRCGVPTSPEMAPGPPRGPGLRPQVRSGIHSRPPRLSYAGQVGRGNGRGPEGLLDDPQAGLWSSMLVHPV